jgi:bacillopeptidase F
MRLLFTLLLCLAIIGPATAGKPAYDTPEPSRVPCNLTNVIHDWDFALGPQGFTTAACDDQGVPVWEHGATTYIPDAPGNVWGTVLEGDYPTDSGEALLSPPITIEASAALMEVHHYYSAENLWEGGNVKVNGELLTPLVGYPGMMSVPGDWYAWCVDFEMGFTGVDSGWLTSCFDLSAFIGQTIQISFEFGSDDTVTEAGWYIASVKIGNDSTVATESRTWDDIKSLYR